MHPRKTRWLFRDQTAPFLGSPSARSRMTRKIWSCEVSKVILAPYKEEYVDEALDLLQEGGGFDQLHMAFYKTFDLGNDEEWDIWRLEGPTFVWHFRAAPHVHA